MLISAFLIVLQAGLFLSTQWNSICLSKIAYKKSTRADATHILVKPRQKQFSHKPYRIVLLRRTPLIEFDYLHKRFTEQQGFTKVKYPVSLEIGQFRNYKGHTPASLLESKCKYEGNKMDLPIPTYQDLMKEHVVAPFFIFQLFCVLLWMLDEYWQLSMYTLLMLIVFESTVVMQRIMNWKRIKQMRKPPQKVKVQRNNKSIEISSEELLPMDLLLFDKSENKIQVPCDAVIIHGSCTVDESILTGEAVPQLKEDAGNKEGNLDMKKDKNVCLMGGTEILSTPGMRCIVLRTGWDTTQGKLMRKILYSDRITLESKEAFIFIGILLCFALAATAYVVYYSYGNKNKDQYKLLLKCVIIITSVVPPELPIELALAVNNSILCLQKKSIFCTEPYRLPLSGKATICCFDKTGTLTDQNFEVKGLCKDKGILEIKSIEEAGWVVAGCNTLTELNGELIGDPIEQATFKAIGGRCHDGYNLVNNTKIVVVKRFGFNSEVKRMSAIVEVSGFGTFLVCKGAPEYLESLLESVPSYYNSQLTQLTSQGFRVLTLCFKPLLEKQNWQDLQRTSIETDLKFLSFLVLKSPLKRKTDKIIKEIKESSHEVVMITGDNVYTAAQVALDLKFGEEILYADYSIGSFQCLDSLKVPQPLSPSSILCISGENLNSMLPENVFFNCKVFARMSPAQKEIIIAKLNERHISIMCGDGTNDVGGLKRAHAGISLVNKALPTVAKNPAQGMTSDILELGDASMAAHFTSKVSTIKAVKHLIQQGRCTLVTTYQMYRILALNCLFSAYNLSVMYLDGIKFGDTQATISAICISAFFFFVSRAQPMEKLSKFHPPRTVFEPQIIVSVFVQFVIQIVGLVTVSHICRLYSIDILPVDQEFKPCLLNSALFIYTSWIGAVNFLVNYQGEPFMKPLSQNGGLITSLKYFMLGLIGIVLEIVPVGDVLEIVPFPGFNVKTI